MSYAHAVYRISALVGLTVLMLGRTSHGQAFDREVAESAGAFEDTLSPHGDWYDSDEYGRLWVPHRSAVGDDFVPYSTAGHWESTQHGWLFVSHWHWGWLPFHYGNWIFDPDLGWAWVPGDVWAPARVRWRSSNEYVGWMPEPPPGYDVPDSWVFVHTRDFCRPRIWRHVLPRRRFAVALRRTSPLRERVRVRHYRWYRGPRVRVVRSVSAAPVRTVSIAPPARNTIVRIDRRGGRTHVRHSSDRVYVRRRRARIHRRIDQPAVRRGSVTVSGPRAVDRRRRVRRSRYPAASDSDRSTTRRRTRTVRTTGERPTRVIRSHRGRRRVHGSGAAPARPGVVRTSTRRRRPSGGSYGTSTRRKSNATSSQGKPGTTSSQGKRRKRAGGGGAKVIRRRAPAAQ